ncbi:MAG TPA: MBL fold metallo-hydrolase, partial [Candidatus Nanoarchaeia archaeon]|nr:MBL fold metallo-hydrolase [Candidatus Nanoarchaeia archaeon]
EHPSRANTEKEFIMKAREVLARGGNVYVPVFGVGRAQEILLLLHNYSWDVPIHLDGMSQDVTDLIINDKACRDPKLLRKAAEKTIYLHGRIQRARAMKQQGIFVTTSGMLTGGPVLDYLKENYNDQKSAFLLTGFVIEGTNGRTLLDSGYVVVDGAKLKVKAEYHQYDFSAHAGLSDLRMLIQKLNPKTLILVHGDDDALNNLAAENKKKRTVFIPKLGDEIVV